MKKGIIMFIPGAISIFIFVFILIFVGIYFVEVEPRVQMEASTSADRDAYQSHIALNALLRYQDGHIVELVREYSYADSSRRNSIESEISTIMENEFSSLEGSRLIIVFEDGSRLDIGDGRVTRSRTTVATPKGNAVVRIGVNDVNRGGSS